VKLKGTIMTTRYETRQKPGVAGRATMAFALLNLPLFATTWLCYFMAGGDETLWWLRCILALGFAVAEFTLVTTTIGPPLMEWIESKETVAVDDSKASQG
jgi:hypothetical protein